MQFQTCYEPTHDDRPPGGGRPEHRRHIKQFPGVLDVVAVVSNPVRYRARYDLYRAFERMVVEAGARLTTVELAHGGRHFEVTEQGNPRHVQLRNDHELWLKENLINIGVSRLPGDWRYVAWVDADIEFARPDWVQETLQRLQHHAVVQMWSHAIDLGPDFEPINNTTHLSFAHCQQEGYDWTRAAGLATPYGPSPGGNKVYFHPGFAWAMRREAFDALGGLIDFAILGAADHHMANALFGRVLMSTYPGVHPNYVKGLTLWQERAEKHIRRNVGCVPGSVFHYFHGPKKARRYWDRWKILVENGFDPEADTKRDWQGLLQLTDRSIGLRDDIRAYLRQRDEDASSNS